MFLKSQDGPLKIFAVIAHYLCPRTRILKLFFLWANCRPVPPFERWLMSRIRFALFLSLLRCSLSTHLLHSTEFIPKVRDFFYDVEGIAEKQSRAVSPILIKFAGEMC